jgi:Uma2 family endonuclease
MIQLGILEEHDRVQLLEGWIVEKMTHNPPHDTAVDLAHAVISVVLPDGWRVRVQSAITTRDSEPEPDIAVVRGLARRYARAHPGPRDIGMLVEVADASLQDDRTVQARIYARARLPVYWSINLIDRCVEVYSKPKGGRAPCYGTRQDYFPSDSIPLILEGKEVALIAVDDLLP